MRAERASWCTATAWSSSARTSASSAAARVSIKRSPRCTCPSRRPSSVGRKTGPRVSSRSGRHRADGRSQEQVAAQARVQLRRLAAEGGHADCVFEEAARGGVMAVGGGGQASQLTSKVHVVDETGGSRTQSRVRDLAREELEEAVELVGVSSQRGQARRDPGPRQARASAHRAEACRGRGRPGRGRARRHLQRSANRVAPRRSRPWPRCDRSGRRAPEPGTARRPWCVDAPSSQPRRRPRRPGPAPARQSRTRLESRSRNGW